MEKNKIILYETADTTVKLDVNTDGNTVWLNRSQLAELFDRDVKTIGKHVNNALKEELDGDTATVAKFATVQIEGERKVSRDIDYYNLDVIISVGYRVKSQRGVEFRKWANKVLKDYIISGVEIYPSLEEKAANLLYLITKNHSFSDGNKRIAAAMFLYFLDKNEALFLDKAKTEKTIADQTLATLTIMIAESNPAEKDMMIHIIMNCMTN